MPESMPKIRDDLIIREIQKADGRHYVIKDPITGDFFEVREPEYFIISSFDGVKTFAEIVEEFKAKFGLEINDAAVIGFANKLQELCFLDNDETRQTLLQRQHTKSKDEQQRLLYRMLYIKLKAFDPGRLFNYLLPYVRFFFTRGFVLLALIISALALLITLSNAHELTRAFAGLITVKGIIILYVSTAIVVLLHEFAHGLTCTYYGGEVHEIGFLLMLFQPCFYCNVSDAWLFPKKSQRIWVTFAGGFFQLFLWALAVFVWRITQTDILLNQVAVAVMSFSGIATVFNFNPLLRFDGYYMLSDYVEIPNLRAKAGQYWRSQLRAIFFGDRNANAGLSARERRIFFYYGFFSGIYVVFVLGYLLYLLGWFLTEQYGGTGFVIFVAILVFLFRNVIMDTARGIGSFFKARADFFRKRTTLSLILLVIIVLVLLAAFGNWELRVKGELELAPSRVLALKYSSVGYVELIRRDDISANPGNRRDVSVFAGDYNTTRLLPLVSPEDSVINGQVIARLLNTETAQLISEYTSLLKKEQEELALLEQGARDEEIAEARNTITELEAAFEAASRDLSRKQEMLNKDLIARQEWEDARTDSVIKQARLDAARNRLNVLTEGARPEEINAKKAEVKRLEGLIAFHADRQDFNEIKATINGVVLATDTGEVACEIASIDTLIAWISLSEKDLADIVPGQKVKFKARSFPSLSFYGEVFRMERKVTVGNDGRRIIRIACLVPNLDHRLRPGMTGVANIYCGERAVSYLIYRKFFRTIRTEFWDWFDWS